MSHVKMVERMARKQNFFVEKLTATLYDNKNHYHNYKITGFLYIQEIMSVDYINAKEEAQLYAIDAISIQDKIRVNTPKDSGLDPVIFYTVESISFAHKIYICKLVRTLNFENNKTRSQDSLLDTNLI